MIERSLVIIKPDGVKRGIIGEVISRFEKVGLKPIGFKMVRVDEETAKNHYQVTEEWANDVFEKTKKGYAAAGKEFSFDNAMDYGNMVQEWNRNFLKEGPVVAVVFEGEHAVEIIRKLAGHTEPRQALPGTIRGDLYYESYAMANNNDRAVRNLIHASGDVKEAEREIELWFKMGELVEKKD
ncbi:MAG: nucleoside-diphosphate kinase [Candidatus Woesearchaeota archaeon]